MLSLNAGIDKRGTHTVSATNIFDVCCRGLQIDEYSGKKHTVCPCGWHHLRVDSINLLQLLNSNIVEFVLRYGSQKKRLICCVLMKACMYRVSE